MSKTHSQLEIRPLLRTTYKKVKIDIEIGKLNLLFFCLTHLSHIKFEV